MIKSTVLIERNYLFNYIAQIIIVLLKFLTALFKRITLKQKTVASLIKLLEKICEISIGL